MEKLKFTSVTEENSNVFHSLMQMYGKELDEHQNRNTDSEMLKGWTDSIIEKQFDFSKCLKLCYAESVVIGFLFGKIDQPEDKGFKKVGFGCIMEFFVLPEHRRKGYGKQMFGHLADYFKANQVKQMYLTADPVTGKPFWEELGFIRTGEISPQNKQEIYEKAIPDETISITVSEFLSPVLVKQIAMAQWNKAEWSSSITNWVYESKTQTDCFNVIAKNECDEVVGRLFCLQNKENHSLWYYGDMFVVPEYRRRHIAEQMLTLAEHTLIDKWCRTLRCYVEPENIPSKNLQKKFGFTERPYEKFNDLLNDGQIMFEKELAAFNVVEAKSKEDARYVTEIYGKNIEALHGNEIMFDEWNKLLSSGDTDEKHFLILKGAIPCAYLKVNGLEIGDNIGWISMLVVEPAFQGKGVGTYSVSYAEEFLHSMGKTTVKIHTTADNIPAQKLYEKCGYSLSDDGEGKITYTKVLDKTNGKT
ncbi:MAG: GNAT family N-acetyltransferase [Oscillospiraceae bacterium]